MNIRHGSPIIMLAALLSVTAGGIAFALDQNVLVALAAAALVLLICAVVANRRTVLEEPARPKTAVAAPPQPVDTRTPLSQPTALAAAALIYLTLGALILVWTGVWWYYLEEHPPARLMTWYFCYGLVGTGLVLVVLAPLIGPIGRAARRAELPPPEVTPAPGEPEAAPLASVSAAPSPGGAVHREPIGGAGG